MVKKIRAKRGKGNAAPSDLAGLNEAIELVKGIVEPDLDGEASAVLELLRVDLSDLEAVKGFRTRYPLRASSWKPVEPTEGNLLHARAIVDLVGQALLFGNADAWTRLEQAYAVMRRIEHQDQRIAACVRILHDAVELWHRSPESRGVMVGFVRKDLTFYDSAFGTLSAKSLEQAFQQTKPRSTTKNGGKGNVGALGLAADLVLDSGAFGQSHRPQIETREQARKRVKDALGMAAKRAKKRLPPT